MERESWLEWRKKGIGASDAPTIMGVSPWSTPYKLWEEKTGLLVKKDSGNWATQRGNDLEPVARARYEFESGLEFPATLATHKEFEFLRASLDGYNIETDSILEIKCPGAADHATAVQGKVPDKYYPQLQHQLMVTGAKECRYVSYDGKESLAVVIVYPDLNYIADLFKKEAEFWLCVKGKTPPQLTDKDTVFLESVEMLNLAEQYIALDLKSKEIDVEIKEVRRLITAQIQHPRSLIGRLSVTKSYRNGSVDYSAVPQLEGVDLDSYRKEGTSSVTFTIKKG